MKVAGTIDAKEPEAPRADFPMVGVSGTVCVNTCSAGDPEGVRLFFQSEARSASLSADRHLLNNANNRRATPEP